MEEPRRGQLERIQAAGLIQALETGKTRHGQSDDPISQGMRNDEEHFAQMVLRDALSENPERFLPDFQNKAIAVARSLGVLGRFTHTTGRSSAG